MSFLCKNEDDKAQSLRQKKFFILEKTNKLGAADLEDAKNVSLVCVSRLFARLIK